MKIYFLKLLSNRINITYQFKHYYAATVFALKKQKANHALLIIFTCKENYT